MIGKQLFFIGKEATCFLIHLLHALKRGRPHLPEDDDIKDMICI